MGKVLLVWRLVVKDVRHRPVLAMLLVLAIAAGAATLTLGLGLRGTTDNPYARTRAATNGPDVVANDISGDPQVPAEAGDLAFLEHAPGVTAYSGPFPVTWASLEEGHTKATAEVEGRSSVIAAVDQPKLTQGTWVRPGGVVIEAAFAAALGLRIGDRLSLGGSSFQVVGVAVTAAFASYPVASALGGFLVGSLGSTNDIGLVWIPESEVAHVAAAGNEPVFHYLNLKLADPAGAQAFVDRYHGNGSATALSLYSWETIRNTTALVLGRAQLVLYTGSWLLVLLALGSVAVLVGGRMTEETHRVGLLKAVGATPTFVTVVLLCEYALIGLGAAGVGLLAGRLAAPLIDHQAGLLGTPNAPSLTASAIGSVVALALGVAIAATVAPAIRAARQSTVAALADSAHTPGRRAGVIRFSAHLPAPLLLGVRLAVRRPARLLLSAFSVAVTMSGIVAVLILRVTTGNQGLGPVVGQATTTISLMLVVLAAVNAVFIAWTTALESRHPAAIARALGATPQQVAAGLSVTLVLPALLGALLGIPGGIGLHHAVKRAGATPIPPVGWLAVMVFVTLLVIAVLTAVPLMIDARRPVAEAIRAETM